MPGLFQGLELGKRALLTHQLSLQTIGHNITNVNTPGYSRQRVNISSTLPEVNALGSIGTGVQADDIRQIRDLFLGQQYREAQKSLGQWTYKNRTLSQIQSLVNEPQDNALGDMLNKFWDSWSQLSTNADSTSSRANVLAQAKTLVNGFHQLSEKLSNLRQSIDADITNFTSEVNRITAEVASLNQQISSTELGGSPANDLRDQRDLLVDDLSKLIDVRTIEKPNGATMVSMGGMVLVDGSDDFPIGVNTINDKGTLTHEVVWKGTTVELRNLNGQLYGLLESRDKVIPDYLAQLDKMSQALVGQVNTLHESGHASDGSAGMSFFDPSYTTASTIRINDMINNDSSLIVASQGTASDNLIALGISGLRDKPVIDNNSVSLNDYYNSLVGKLGIETSESESFTKNFELLAQQVDNSRQSVQGVSLDEEMTNMIKFQHAYDAAARVITTMDQALDTVVNSMGIVGR
jgi:flagellar hook-associated protein 1 FlgK